MKNLNIGLDASQRENAIVILNRVLATENIMMIKTKKFEWNIIGPQFMQLHSLWEKQHREMGMLADKVAERVRVLGGVPVGTAAAFVEHSAIEESPGDILSATDAVLGLTEGHEMLVRTLRSYVDQCDRDRGTEDVLITLLKAHEHMAWMLRSFVEGEQVVSDGKLTHGQNVPSLA